MTCSANRRGSARDAVISRVQPKSQFSGLARYRDGYRCSSVVVSRSLSPPPPARFVSGLGITVAHFRDHSTVR